MLWRRITCPPWIAKQQADLGVVRGSTVANLQGSLLEPALVEAGFGAGFTKFGRFFMPREGPGSGTMAPAAMLRKCIRLVVCNEVTPRFFDQVLRPVLAALQLSAPQEIEVAIVALDPIGDLTQDATIWNLNNCVWTSNWAGTTGYRPGLEHFINTLPRSIAERLFAFDDWMPKLLGYPVD